MSPMPPGTRCHPRVLLVAPTSPAQHCGRRRTAAAVAPGMGAPPRWAGGTGGLRARQPIALPAAGAPARPAADSWMCRRGQHKCNQIRNSLSERRRLESVTLIALEPSVVAPRLPPPFLERCEGTAGWVPGTVGCVQRNGVSVGAGKGSGEGERSAAGAGGQMAQDRAGRCSRRCLRWRLTAKVSGAQGCGRR